MSANTPPSPPEAPAPLRRLARRAKRPLERFLAIEAGSGLLLMLAAAVALVSANSPWGETYARFWQIELGARIGRFVFTRPLVWFVNDVLMVVFFFVVGLEIRREIRDGELSEWRRAALPAAAALGGMLAPAGLYLLLASGPATRSGWGDLRHLVVVGVVAGVGFTMALFIAQLAFPDAERLSAAKLGVLVGSGGAATLGVVLGRLLLKTAGPQRRRRTA